MRGNGYNALWLWFDLSYASWLTIPRVLMHQMPDEWQRDMAKLLNDYDAAYPNQPDWVTRVQLTHRGGLIKTPSWVINYRHPEYDEIKKLRGKVKI